MKIGDLVIDDRSRMEKTNFFYNAWLRFGLILELNSHLDKTADDVATVMWWENGKTQKSSACYVSKLEVINEC